MPIIWSSLSDNYINWLFKCWLETAHLSSADSRCIISRKIPKMPYDKNSSWFQAKVGWCFHARKAGPFMQSFLGGCCPFSSMCHSGMFGVVFQRETPKFCVFPQRAPLPVEDLPRSEEFQHNEKLWSQENFSFEGNLWNVLVIPSLIFLLLRDFLVAYLQIHSIIIINNSEGSPGIFLPFQNGINNINFNDILANAMMLLHLHNGLPHWEKWVWRKIKDIPARISMAQNC